jgi:hypothetical protein
MDWVALNVNTPSKTPKMQQYCDCIEWPDGEWRRVRPIGPVISIAYHWLTVSINGNRVTFPKACLNYDPTDGIFRENEYNKRLISGCPYCDSPFPPIPVYWSNFIDRLLQDDRPYHRSKPLPEERQRQDFLGYECRFKIKGSKTWTPIRAGRITPKLAEKLHNLVKLNYHPRTGQKKCFSLSHPRYGVDIAIYHDRGPPARYDAQRGEQVPLTEREQNYLWQNIACLKPEKFEVATQAYQTLKSKLIVPPDYQDMDQTDRDHADNDDQDNYSVERGRRKQPRRPYRRPFWNYDDD